MKILAVLCDKDEAVEIEKMLRHMEALSGGKQSSGEGCCWKVSGIAGGGKTGYEMIRRECPDLVIADIELAEISGLDMLEKLRGEHSDVRAVLLADRENFAQAKRAIDLGVEGYLVKPVRADELWKAVTRAEKKWKREQTVKSVVSLENTFLSCLNGQIRDRKSVV